MAEQPMEHGSSTKHFQSGVELGAPLELRKRSWNVAFLLETAAAVA